MMNGHIGKEIKGVKDLHKYAIIAAVNFSGGVAKVFEAINDARQAGEITSLQAFALRDSLNRAFDTKKRPK